MPPCGKLGRIPELSASLFSGPRRDNRRYTRLDPTAIPKIGDLWSDETCPVRSIGIDRDPVLRTDGMEAFQVQGYADGRIFRRWNILGGEELSLENRG